MNAHRYEIILEPEEFQTFLKARMGSASVQDFADKMGVSRQMLYFLMEGRRKPSKAILKKLNLRIVFVVDTAKSKGAK